MQLKTNNILNQIHYLLKREDVLRTQKKPLTTDFSWLRW